MINLILFSGGAPQERGISSRGTNRNEVSRGPTKHSFVRADRVVKIFGKEFGKGKDEFIEPGRSLAGAGVPGPAADDFSTPLGPPVSFPPSSSSAGSEQIELLSSKLDTIKASIDALNQRLASIEMNLKQQPAQQSQAPPQQPSPFSPTAPAPAESDEQQSTQEDQGWHY